MFLTDMMATLEAGTVVSSLGIQLVGYILWFESRMIIELCTYLRNRPPTMEERVNFLASIWVVVEDVDNGK